MGNIFADLHNHTTRSDGTTKPDDVVNIAKNNGLSAIALTDHDVTQEFDHPLVVRDGVDIVSGIKLRVEPESLDERVLGYGVVDDCRLSSVLIR